MKTVIEDCNCNYLLAETSGALQCFSSALKLPSQKGLIN